MKPSRHLNLFSVVAFVAWLQSSSPFVIYAIIPQKQVSEQGKNDLLYACENANNRL